MSVRSNAALNKIRRLKRDLPLARIARRGGQQHGEDGARKNRSGGARGKSWSAVSVLLFLMLIVLGGRAYIGQRFNISAQVERVLRTQIAPQLEKQLGEKVEFGVVETDWLGRVLVRDVLVGRDARLPTGALLRAREISVSLDLPGLALGRAALPDAIRAVTIRDPQIYLRRDARGFNLARLLPKKSGGKSARWSGQVSIENGRVYYLDTTLKNAEKSPLLMDARGIGAQISASSEGPYRGAIRVETPLFGAQKLRLRPISATGALEADAKNGLFSVQADGLPFAPLLSYASPRREIVALSPQNGAQDNVQDSAISAQNGARSGTLSARAAVVLSNGKVAAHGALQLENLAFAVPSTRVPGSKDALKIEALSGPIQFADNAFSTSGARLKTFGSDFQIAGAASMQAGLPFDFTVETPALPLATLRALAAKNAPRGTAFSAAPTMLRAHLTGNAGGQNRQIAARGTLETASANLALDARKTPISASSTDVVSGANPVKVALQTLRTSWAATATLRPDNSLTDWKVAARARVSASKSALTAGEFSTQDAVFSVRAARDAGVEIGADAPIFAANSPRYGRTSGRDLHLLTSAPDAMRPVWNGAVSLARTATNGVRWNAVSPALSRSLKSSGALDLNAQFAGLDAALDTKKLRGAATFRLSALQLDSRAFALPNFGKNPQEPLLRDADFALSALQGRVALSDGVVSLARATAVSSFGPLRLDASAPLRAPNAARIALSLPDVRVAATRIAPFLRAQNVQLSGDWRGRITLLSRATRRINFTGNSRRNRGDSDSSSAANERATVKNATDVFVANGVAANGITGSQARNLQPGTRVSADANAPASAADADNSAPSFGVEFDLRAPAATLRGDNSAAGAVILNAPTLRGTGEFSSRNTAQSWRASGVFGAQSGSLRGGNLGRFGAIPIAATGARARDLRFEVALRASDFRGGKLAIPARLSAASASVPLAISAVPKNGARATFLTLTNLGADLRNGSDGPALPRFAADFLGGQVRGKLQITPRGPQGEILASGVDTARAQRLFAPASRDAAQLSGLASAFVEIRAGAAPRAQLRLDSGAVRVIPGADSNGVRTVESAARAFRGASSGGLSGDSGSASGRVWSGILPGAASANFGAANTARNDAGATIFPLQNARATVVVSPDGALQISDARVWSAGTRVAGEAALQREIWRGKVSVSDARLAPLSQLPLVPEELRAARADGLASAAFSFVFDAKRARLTALSGRADLELAEVFGARIESLGGQIALRSVGGFAPVLTLENLNGNVEGADVSGAARADFAGNSWRANLQWSGAQTARLARIQALLGVDSVALNATSGRENARASEVFFAPNTSRQSAASREIADASNAALTNDFASADAADTINSAKAESVAKAAIPNNPTKENGAANANINAAANSNVSAARAQVLERAFPVTGTLSGQVELSGTLFDARGDLAPRARDGAASLASDALIWRGRELGTLELEAKLENGIVRLQTLQLARTAGSAGVPLVQVSGTLPLDARTPGLDARVEIGSAPLAFFTGIVAESGAALRNSGVQIPFFERVVSYVDALPVGTTGQVALAANLSGSWSAPRVAVSNLTLRDGRTRLPSGGFSPPATLDAAFVFDKGTVTIEKTEFRLKKIAAVTTSATGAAEVSNLNSDDESDDTLLRVEPDGSAMPDGPISLAADVFNANLSQLSPWVPALRGSDGAPLLRGDLSEFSFRVGGTTPNPNITGSIQGENLKLQNYTLDRLRVSRFEIGDGSARIEPGNLTVVKGAFQSSAPYGRVPWSWAPLGPVLDGAIDVHFPLQTRDFGALIGAFVPALSVADAEEFSGSVDVAGTLRAPALSGAITIRDGQFRLDEKRGAFAAGLKQVSGTVRFVGATAILIDADDPLRGKFVSANQVVGRVARRVETALGSTPVNAVNTASSGANSGGETARGAAKTAAASSKNAVVKTGDRQNSASRNAAKSAVLGDPNLKMAGDFVVRGGVVRPTSIDALGETPEELPSNSNLSRAERRASAARLRALLDPAAALSRLKYDLSMELNGGAFASGNFGGVSDISAALIWKTGDAQGEGEAQNVRWMLAARGQKSRASKNGGEVTSFGAVALQRNFGAGIDALARSAARDFSGESDFSTFGVAKRIDVARAPDRRAQFNFDRFAASLTGAGNGVLDGRLVLDNGAVQQKAPASAVRLQNARLQLGARNSAFSSRIERDFALNFASQKAPKSLLTSASAEKAEEQDGENGVASTPETSAGEPLRLGGVLTLSSAEIYGAPEGGAGTATALSTLPGAPRFDIRLKMGRDVQVVTAAFRSGLEGEMVAQGTPRDPRISGVLNTRGGQVRFPNARARVDEGRVSISLSRDQVTDTLRTRLDIDATARGQSGIYTIVLNLHGPLDLSGVQNAQSLQIDVSSTPPLSQSEAFEQLLGTAPSLEYDAETRSYKTGSVNAAYTNAVLNVISAPLFSGVEQTLAQTLGLTSVGLEYRFNEPLAVQVTKALGDRIFISYRRSLGSGPEGNIASGTASRRTPFELRIQYRIKGNYLLGLQTDERQIPTITLQKTLRF